MAALASRPDGILVSQETITDYSVRRGDMLRLRVLDRRTATFRVVPFRVVGVVQEFPSAPRDSFMVANLAYLEAAGHGLGPNVVFAKAAGDPVPVARRVAATTARDGTRVSDIRHQRTRTVSSITAVSLGAVGRIETAFVIALAACAMTLFVALALAERRVEFATMAALGASPQAVAAFIWTETALVLGAATLLAAGLGWLLARMLVTMLTHAFDPPPDALTIPWSAIGELAAGATLAAGLAVAVAYRAVRRLEIGSLLREQ
jgi:putative ABC transport system permease protein